MAAQNNKRQRLTDAAMRLFHTHGYHKTSLADIAREARVPLGGIYYYFKTKDEIGIAVLETHAQRMRTAMAHWELDPDPLSRLHAYVDMTETDRETFARSGCPIGSLCLELDRDDDAALAAKATDLLRMSADWVEAQFRALGHRDSAQLALHLVSVLQGSALVANAFQDPVPLVQQCARMHAWINGLGVSPVRIVATAPRDA